MLRNLFCLFFFTILTLPSVNAGFLERSLGLFNSFFEEEETRSNSLINYCNRSDLNPDLERNAQCAEQICQRNPAPSVYLSTDGINQRLNENSSLIEEEFGAAQNQLEETLRGLEATQRALHNHAKERMTQMIAAIDSMEGEDLARLSHQILTPYISNYRFSSNSSSPFTYIPETLPEMHHQALREFSQRAWNMRDQYPTTIRPSDSVETQRQKARDAINAIKENASRYMTDRSGRMDDLQRAIDFRLQLVSRASGEELEKVLIDTDTVLKRTFYLSGELNLVNYDNMNSCESDNCKAMLKELVKQDIDQKIAEATETDANGLVANAMMNCRSRYGAHILEDMSDSSARESYEEVLRAYLENGLANFSDHSKRVFEQHANSQMVVAQNITKNSGQDFINYLNQREPPPRRFADNVQSLFVENDYLLLVMTDTIRSKRSERFNLDSVCPDPVDAVGLNQFTSGSQTGGQGIFRVGQGVNHHFLHGKQAIARELTFVLVDSVQQGGWSSESLEMFQAFRGCAVQNYAPGEGNNNRSSGPYFENDLYTTNGDFADLMAFRTYPNEPQLYGCGLFESVSNDRVSSRYQLIHNHPEQTDSTPFMRLIQEAIHKNIDLPRVCEQVIQENSNRIGTRSCL